MRKKNNPPDVSLKIKYAKTKLWQDQHREAVKKHNAEYYKKNREKRLAKARADYAANRNGMRDKIIKRQAEYTKKNYRKVRSSQRQSRHGISEESYQLLLVTQGHQCAACGCDLTAIRPHEAQIDHCHQTKKIRAILCGPCNRALGLLSDDPIKAQRLADYIKSHSAS